MAVSVQPGMRQIVSEGATLGTSTKMVRMTWEKRGIIL
jgi:hypothetical protein